MTDASITRDDVPVKSVNPDLTVEERLDDHVLEQVLPARYLEKSPSGTIVEDADGLFRRVAEDVAKAEFAFGGNERHFDEKAQLFYEALSQQEIMANTPALINMGTKKQMGSACFVLDIPDDLTSIMQTAEKAAKIFQLGGGVGYAFSEIRPKGDLVSTTGGEASGPVSFMNIYDAMCGTIKQGGVRRGAQMAILSVDHPDVARFCVCKRREGDLSNFNISVGLTEEFKQAVKNDESYSLVNPRTDSVFRVSEQTEEFYSTEYEDSQVEENFWRDYASGIQNVDKWRGKTDIKAGDHMELPAGFIFDILVDGAWRNGEPGVVDMDEINEKHAFDPQKHPEYEVKSTNPCSEQPLLHGDSCNLCHINLSLLLKEDSPLWPNYDGDIETYLNENVKWDRLRQLSRLSTVFLDNMIERNEYPVEDVTEETNRLRKVGVGIMGFAQFLVQAGIEYGSDESAVAAEELMGQINRATLSESHELAKERGVFGAWHESKFSEPMENPEWFEDRTEGLSPESYRNGLEMRGYDTTTIAPTGTTSQIASTSGGCEPIYRAVYQHHASGDIGSMAVFDDMFISVAEKSGYDIDELKEEAQELMENNELELENLVSDDIASLFKTADQVTPEEHMKVQEAFQKHVGSSISKTVNLPNDASHEDVEEVYLRTFEGPAKACAVYRDGSRQDQVKSDRGEENKLDEECPECGETLVKREGCEECPNDDCVFSSKCEI